MNNQKITPVKELLGDALFKLLSQKSFGKISVQELCQLAAVSRSTFYANFQDKYHLLSYYINRKTEELDLMAPPLSPDELLERILNYFHQEQALFSHMLSDGMLDELIGIFYQFFNRRFLHALKQKEEQGIVLPGPADVISSFYIGGLTMMTLRWIKSNYKQPAKELAACQYELLKTFF